MFDIEMFSIGLDGNDLAYIPQANADVIKNAIPSFSYSAVDL